MNPEMSYASQDSQQTPETASQGFLSRLIGVYFSPGETFQDVGRAPNIVLPLILLVALTVVGTVVVFSIVSFDQMMNQQIEQSIQSGRVTPEQAETQRAQMQRMAPFMKYISPLFAAISIIVITLIIAGIAKLISMMMGIENKFMPLWSVTVYATLAISIITMALFIIIAMLKPAEDIDITNPIGSNLGALLPMMGVTGLSKFLKMFLSYVDIFYIWKVILLGIGFAAVSQKLKASTSIAVSLVVAFVFALGGAAWTSMFS